MQLITTRNKEISFAELKKAISSGNGLELIRTSTPFAADMSTRSAPASSSRTASRISGA